MAWTEKELRKMMRDAVRSVNRTRNTRANLEPGSTRARVTTANARYWTACEEWDRVQQYARDAGREDLIEEFNRERGA